MLRKVLTVAVAVAMAVVMMSGDAFAGGGGKNNGTLVVNNGDAVNAIAVVIDPPAAWAAWVAPFTQAQKDALAAKATIIPAAGKQSFSVKKGAHKVLAVDTVTELFTLTDVNIVKKQTTTITVTP